MLLRAYDIFQALLKRHNIDLTLIMAVTIMILLILWLIKISLFGE